MVLDKEWQHVQPLFTRHGLIHTGSRHGMVDKQVRRLGSLLSILLPALHKYIQLNQTNTP